MAEAAERIPPEEIEVGPAPDEPHTRFDEIDQRVRDFVVAHPLVAVAAAVSAGYLIGRALRRL